MSGYHENERLIREQIAAEIEAQRKPMPETQSVAALTGWVMRDQALVDAGKIALGTLVAAVLPGTERGETK